MIKKEGNFYFFLVLVLLLILLISNFVSSLGVSPSRETYNFKPGGEYTIKYRVLSETNKQLEISAQGDLAKYATINDDNFENTKEFSVSLNLPEKIDTPGQNRILIVVSEQADPEVSSFIATTVTVRSIIDIYVPYPGQYLEIDLRGKDANVGEPIDFELGVLSKGDEEVHIAPVIKIYSESNGDKTDELYFSERDVKSQESVKLKKTLNTSGYNPGKYKAVAEINYGLLANDEFEFRIGSLNINLLNYTNLFFNKNGLTPFKLIIESGWNDNIDGTYGEIKIYNDTWTGEIIKTTTTPLTPWEKKEIVGYFDSENFSSGVYKADITLHYFGGERGSSNSETVNVFFQEKPKKTYWYYVGGGGILLFVIAIILRYFFVNKKNGKKKKGKKRR